MKKRQQIKYKIQETKDSNKAMNYKRKVRQDKGHKKQIMGKRQEKNTRDKRDNKPGTKNAHGVPAKD